MNTPPRFVCSKCGGPSVTRDESLTAIDERYPVGYCANCTPVPKPRLRPGTSGSKDSDWVTPARRRVTLLRANLDDPADRAHRAKVAHARKLARDLHDPKKTRRMSQAEIKAASDATLWLRRPE